MTSASKSAGFGQTLLKVRFLAGSKQVFGGLGLVGIVPKRASAIVRRGGMINKNTAGCDSGTASAVSN